MKNLALDIGIAYCSFFGFRLGNLKVIMGGIYVAMAFA